MKIIQLTHSLRNGGAEKFIVELSNELSKEHELLLCTYKPNEDWMLSAKNISPRVRNISLNTGSKKSITNWTLIYRLLKKEKPDVVHVHASLVAFYLIIFPIFFPKVKFIQTIHSTITLAYTKLFRYFSSFRFICKKWNHVCISKSICNDFSNKFNHISFSQIDNGIIPLTEPSDYNKIEPEIINIKNNKNAKLLVAIGNYSDFKRFDMLIEIMNYFHNQNLPLYLMLLGEDKSLDKINYNKVLQNKSENVFILGLKSNVADYISIADAMIISSSKEGMPLVILEAMSLGKPVISSPAGGIVDMIVNGENGFLADDLTEIALKTALLKYLNSNEKDIMQISEKNKIKFKEQYSIEKCADKYIKLFNQSNQNVLLD